MECSRMNLPNKLTVSRILLVPLFLIFVIPVPDGIINAQILSGIHTQLVSINNFILNYGNYIGAIIFIAAAMTDKLDGYIARKRKIVTKFGIFLDPIADKLIVTSALIALVQRNHLSGWVAMIIISREFIVTGFRLVAAGEKIVIPAGKWGKVKMVTQTVAVSLALLNNFPFSLVTNIPFDSYIMFLAVIVTIYSGYEYIAKNINILTSGDI
jgi:CDP-diacylglycerol--glycerol-3-phosphate 3-phosphatidyltransferase